MAKQEENKKNTTNKASKTKKEIQDKITELKEEIKDELKDEVEDVKETVEEIKEEITEIKEDVKELKEAVTPKKEQSNLVSVIELILIVAAIAIILIFFEGTTLWNIVVLLLILSVLIFVHEFGHMYSTIDHYGGGAWSTQEIIEETGNYGYNMNCIYGEYKECENIKSNLVICDGCKSLIIANRNRYDHS